MIQCKNCAGFVPGQMTQCPHCGHSQEAGVSAKTLLKIGAGAVMSVTLMACYGGPPRGYDRQPLPDDQKKTQKMKTSAADESVPLRTQ